jgi:hypothetical protein
MVVLLLALLLPVLVWCIFVAVKRQASLKSLFVLVGVECVLFAIVVALKSR